MSLPLLYRRQLFLWTKSGDFCTAMLAFSPIALTWGREARMYEQAQLFTNTFYLIYRAMHERQRAYLIYLAVASLVVTYLSHEETFIICPQLYSGFSWPVKTKGGLFCGIISEALVDSGSNRRIHRWNTITCGSLYPSSDN